MSTFSIRKRNGETVELESEDALTLDEIRELCGEEAVEKNPMLDRLAELVEHLKNQPPPPAPIVHVASASPTFLPAPAAAAKPNDYYITIESRNKDGRPESFRIKTVS